MPEIVSPLGSLFPGDGKRLAIYGGSPGSTLMLEGSIKRAVMIESFGLLTLGSTGACHFGTPMIDNGVTLWIRGVLGTDFRGLKTPLTRTEVLEAWSAVRAKALESNLEIYLQYQTEGTPLFRKIRQGSVAYLQGRWDDPWGFSYELAFISSNRTIYGSGPGLDTDPL